MPPLSPYGIPHRGETYLPSLSAMRPLAVCRYSLSSASVGQGGRALSPVVLIKRDGVCRSYRLYAESGVIFVSAGLTATL